MARFAKSLAKPLAHANVHCSIVLACGCLAAIFYSSWPLGFILNPVIARHDLASMLEAPGQPHQIIFVTADVLTGVLLVVAGTLQLKRSRRHMAAVVAYVLFGALVAAAALTPLKCNPDYQNCVPLLHNPLLLFHGACSILSVLGLLAALALATQAVFRQPSAGWLRRLCIVLLAGWLIFGGGSLLEMAQHIHGNVLQYYFITLCSATIIASIYTLETLNGRFTRCSDATAGNDCNDKP